MIFATDLDRTLIYSRSFLEGCEIASSNIEIYKGEPISYISNKALELLKKLHQVATIIPVTTRNEEQYHRIQLFKEELEPKCYIINNGGTIYYQGKEDREWTLHIREQIKALKVGYDEVLSAFLKSYKGPIERHKKSDDLIWLVLGDQDQIDWQAVEHFKKAFAHLGWKIDVNGRKIYLYPEFINKWSALEYIRKRYMKEEKIMAAGDSLFDYEMVHQADYGVIPRGAWIEEVNDDRGDANLYTTKISPTKSYITEHKGLRAAEDILSMALDKATYF